MKGKRNKSAVDNSAILKETANFLTLALMELKKTDLFVEKSLKQGNTEFYKYFEEIGN